MANEQNPAQTIAELNDRFRREVLILGRSAGVPGSAYLTRGVAALPAELIASVQQRVRAFDAFSEDNDPHGEHDFGAFEIEGVGKLFWKIDYYDPDREHGSEDPADPAKTHRVLTVMLAEEY